MLQAFLVGTVLRLNFQEFREFMLVIYISTSLFVAMCAMFMCFRFMIVNHPFIKFCLKILHLLFLFSLSLK